ncbi:MAG: rRNA pseudouridine synthase [Chitinophagaceae bacterium]|nr:rRNA pseudouridine synthase [Chitinophagaceae bacterium]
MSQSPFQKFQKKKKNSVIKEEFRQEKKKYRKDRNAFFEEKKKEEYQARQAKKGGMATKAADNLKGKSAMGNLPASQAVEQSETGNRQSKIVKGAEVSKPRGAAKTPHQKSAKAIAANDNTPTGIMPLNKFMAHCGVCSRRDAVEYITAGKVKVNGEVVKEPGYKVLETDEVIYNTKKLFVTKNLVYILLNKPKDYITTTDDPQGRKTVLQLIKQATTERVYPIGRLDRNTSGVLLLTNDGDLTQKLSHPSYEIKKIYEVKLDKPLTKADFDKIVKGLKLEDGEILIDSLAYADSKDKSIIGIELHSGRNRIVRRIFEHLGYDVKGLDRVMYANLTKKNVERSKWRYLSEKEIRLLKYMNTSKK